MFLIDGNSRKWKLEVIVFWASSRLVKNAHSNETRLVSDRLVSQNSNLGSFSKTCFAFQGAVSLHFTYLTGHLFHRFAEVIFNC